MKLLLYCTKAKPNIVKGLDNKFYISNAFKEEGIDAYKLNGKIVAECDFEVEKLFIKYGEGWQTDTIKGTENIEKLTCVNREELYQYCKGKGYAIHIKNLHIFDKPRELYDCLIHPKIEPRYYGCEHLSKAPQNMMYVELDDIRYILISIRPEWLCKILNGEKTIEVRKKVLKEMIK